MMHTPLTRHTGSGGFIRSFFAFQPLVIGLRNVAIGVIVAASAAVRVEAANTAPPQPLPWSNARQLLLVVTPDWDSPQAMLQTFERSGRGWRSTTAGTPVVIGKAGSAWGIGLHPAQPGPEKREGDGRSPAGVFALGTAFGYASSARTHWPYAAMSANDYCVDVVGSPLYNRIVDVTSVDAAATAGASEPMRRDLHEHGDQAYKLGFVIEHNPQQAAGAGSCIFAHLWHSPTTGTAGCTAMAEPALQALLAWLRPQDHPVFVLLPKEQYTRLKSIWDLPDLALD